MGGETTRGRRRRPTGATGKFVPRIRGTIFDLEPEPEPEPELAQRPPVSITLRAVLTEPTRDVPLRAAVRMTGRSRAAGAPGRHAASPGNSFTLADHLEAGAARSMRTPR